jgi:hypothetical protein
VLQPPIAGSGTDQPTRALITELNTDVACMHEIDARPDIDLTPSTATASLPFVAVAGDTGACVARRHDAEAVRPVRQVTTLEPQPVDARPDDQLAQPASDDVPDLARRLATAAGTPMCTAEPAAHWICLTHEWRATDQVIITTERSAGAFPGLAIAVPFAAHLDRVAARTPAPEVSDTSILVMPQGLSAVHPALSVLEDRGRRVQGGYVIGGEVTASEATRQLVEQALRRADQSADLSGVITTGGSQIENAVTRLMDLLGHLGPPLAAAGPAAAMALGGLTLGTAAVFAFTPTGQRLTRQLAGRALGEGPGMTETDDNTRPARPLRDRPVQPVRPIRRSAGSQAWLPLLVGAAVVAIAVLLATVVPADGRLGVFGALAALLVLVPLVVWIEVDRSRRRSADRDEVIQLLERVRWLLRLQALAANTTDLPRAPRRPHRRFLRKARVARPAVRAELDTPPDGWLSDIDRTVLAEEIDVAVTRLKVLDQLAVTDAAPLTDLQRTLRDDLEPGPTRHKKTIETLNTVIDKAVAHR